MQAPQPIVEVLLLDPERMRASMLVRSLHRVFPQARVRHETETSRAAAVLAGDQIQFFVASMRGFDLDVLTLLGVWAEHDASRTRVLVVTSELQSTAVTALHSLPIAGVFDTTTGDPDEFELACVTVASGAKYFNTLPNGVDQNQHVAELPAAAATTWRIGPPVRSRERFGSRWRRS